MRQLNLVNTMFDNDLAIAQLMACRATAGGSLFGIAMVAAIGAINENPTGTDSVLLDAAIALLDVQS